MPNPLEPGDKAPEIKLPTESGGVCTLSSFRGSNVVLFFYPKANTPGCTTEACEFRDKFPAFSKAKAVVLGISPDKEKAQTTFKTKFGLPYHLLCDADHATADTYGVWVEKSLYGRKYMGIERTTFLIGPDGKIREIFRKVKPAGHAAEVLAKL
jgi:thioredoxin-dependent peroxiredoxin